MLKDKEVEIVFEFNGLGDWVVYDTGDSGFLVRRLWGLRLYTVMGLGWLL